ncbi:hypothetical protein Tco_0404076 [Tanacetum coccineum]
MKVAVMDAMTIKMDAQYKELQSRTKQPTPDLDDDDMHMSREEEAKFMQTFCKTCFSMIIATEIRIVIIGVQTNGMITIETTTDHTPLTNPSIQNLETKFYNLADKQSGRPSRSLPSNTQPNPRGSNSKAYQPPQARNEHVNAVFTRSGKSYNPPDNLNNEQNKPEDPINFDSDDEDDKPIP